MVHAGAFYWGDVMNIARFKIDENGTASLQTSKGLLMMDADDLGMLSEGQLKFKQSTGGCYASLFTHAKPKKLIGAVARLVMSAPVGLEVDHINHDTLDNRRSNLRICTRSENRRNGRKQRQSKYRYKGISYQSRGTYDGSRGGGCKRWRAYTRVMGKRMWFGYYATEIEAAMAYNRNAARLFGEFTCYNRFDECPVLKCMQKACQTPVYEVLPAVWAGEIPLGDTPAKH
jgi:hypothetical protein